jgi:hypothetical protein
MEHNRAGTTIDKGVTVRKCKCGAQFRGTSEDSANKRHAHILTMWHLELIVHPETLFDLEGGG